MDSSFLPSLSLSPLPLDRRFGFRVAVVVVVVVVDPRKIVSGKTVEAGWMGKRGGDANFSLIFFLCPSQTAIQDDADGEDFCRPEKEENLSIFSLSLIPSCKVSSSSPPLPPSPL